MKQITLTFVGPQVTVETSGYRGSDACHAATDEYEALVGGERVSDEPTDEAALSPPQRHGRDLTQGSGQ